MSFLAVILLGLVVIAIIGVMFVIGIYNSMVQMRLAVREASADIETLLKKRFDLIPNIVATVKGYAKHESETLEKVTSLRAQMASANGDMEALSNVNNEMTKTLKTLFAVAESYPDLKADTSFVALQNELSNLETEIQKSRRYYNATVGEYNVKIQVFPNVLIAPMLGFTPAKFFEAEEEEKKNVKVEF